MTGSAGRRLSRAMQYQLCDVSQRAGSRIRTGVDEIVAALQRRCNQPGYAIPAKCRGAVACDACPGTLRSYLVVRLPSHLRSCATALHVHRSRSRSANKCPVPMDRDSAQPEDRTLLLGV